MSNFNGSGTFQISGIGLPYVPGTLISSSVANTLNNDLATGLSTCILKDGTQVLTADIPWNSKKITGLGAGSASTDAANISNVQASTGQLITVTGTNTLVGTATPALTAYAAGMTFRFFSAGANTAAATLNISGLGAKNIYKDGLVPLVAGDIPAASCLITVMYDGTQFVLVKPSAFTSLSTDTLTVTTATITNCITSNIKENATISATASTGTINYNLGSQEIIYYTSNATANWTVNFRYNSGASLNTYMSDGQAMTAVFMATQGSPAYRNSVIQVDGTTTGVTVKWQGGITPSAGNINGIDIYAYTVIKTATTPSPTYTILASQVQFA